MMSSRIPNQQAYFATKLYLIYKMLHLSGAPRIQLKEMIMDEGQFGLGHKFPQAI
jgi:hypothetical protein